MQPSSPWFPKYLDKGLHNSNIPQPTWKHRLHSPSIPGMLAPPHAKAYFRGQLLGLIRRNPELDFFFLEGHLPAEATEMCDWRGSRSRRSLGQLLRATPQMIQMRIYIYINSPLNSWYFTQWGNMLNIYICKHSICMYSFGGTLG